jgi:3-hydroxyacyl-CoA dehydrogenase/enoyl-CoA hydratase/3-hydroxybutyryl-CoA epimerase
MTSQQLARKARKEHYPAPYAALELWRRHGGNPGRMLGQEARSVARLGQTRTARNLVRVFFLQESLKQLGSKDHGITRVHVVGAGVMGGDIAAWAALQGFEVTLQDRELKYIEPALERARKLFEKRLKQPALIDAARGAPQGRR